MIVEIYPRILTGPVVKSSLKARADYLNQHWPDLCPAFTKLATQSDDAFDAAVSALVMERHVDEFEQLTAMDPLFEIEGQIWTPAVGGKLDKTVDLFSPTSRWLL